MADQGDITRTSPEALRVKTSGFALATALIVFISSFFELQASTNQEIQYPRPIF
jgi:hypothetical protein